MDDRRSSRLARWRSWQLDGADVLVVASGMVEFCEFEEKVLACRFM